jgi:hypothetical protein
MSINNPFKYGVHLNDIYKSSSYLKENIMPLYYKHRFVNAVQRNNRCLL